MFVRCALIGFSFTFSLALAFMLTGCVASVDGSSQQPGDEPHAAFGVVAQPRLGTVIEGPTTSTALTFAGVHARPSYPIAIQIFTSEWITIATTTTGSEPSSTDPGVFEWQAIAAPAQLSPSRWPQGGLLRVRAVGGDGEVLAGLFHDADGCLDQHDTWAERAERCGGTFDNGIVIVSAGDVANSASRPRFLDRLGWVEPLETAQYYQAIAAPTTLTEFRTKYALTATSPTSTYYNGADLGIGRGMSCQPQPDGGVACAVANYGAFGGPEREALDNAVDLRASFATVAMVYTPPLDAPNAVQFMIYGASGALINEAQLDTVGDNRAVPNNCINCHGSNARYDAATHAVTGATFLPFDQAILTFSTRAGFTERDQAPALAQLDQAIVPALSPANRQLVAGWYPSGPAATAEAFVPSGWTGSPLERKVYEHVIATNCRNCHASRDDGLSFATSDMFVANKGKIERSLCITHDMPNAQVPLQHLWNSPARAYLAAYLDIATCSP
jgi:mono/diheme cytochrome c family protein